MVNYQLAKIYKIVCRITGEVYVGSTCEPTLARRLSAHRSTCKGYHEKNRGTYFASFQIILRGDYYIDLLENFPCNSNDELRKKEREYYDVIECINKVRPYLFIEELKAERIIYDKIHKDIIREQQKQYNEKHRERINECSLLNYHKNKKVKTEEQIEAKRLLQLEKAKHMQTLLKEKREAIRRENPNYEIEKKERQKLLHRIACKKFEEKKKELKNKTKLENSV